ncbi:ATP-binding protein [Streptomyces sp. NBC_01808]|uniref:ATP-binding protein n=1 Tax=Streptomyces sp. NBC_01808 TaxID=2975947 RepID=UPI002DDB8356|nr:ATP-binding protein [Streptomyces sp. NBC_01808]WSA37877.1 ATP-binding protein [Streptomyces sp. NBC_01808]
MARRACAVLPGGSTATPECARGIVRSWLTAWQIPPDPVHDTVLIASELTTNATVHTDSSQIIVVVQITGRERRRLTIRVIDQGPSGPDWADRQTNEAAGSDALALTGRGLFLVGELADRWGAVRGLAGTSVWAQLAIPATTAKSALRAVRRHEIGG